MCEIMHSMVIVFLVCFWLYEVTHCRNSIAVASQSTVQDSVFVNGSAAIGTIDDDFVCATMDWWPPEKCDYGTCSWGNASLLNLDLGNDILLNAMKAFSPLKIRLGGTLQDKVIYQTEDGQKHTSFIKDSSQLFGFTDGYLPMPRWDELNSLFKNAGVNVIVGLNALQGRTINSQGVVVGAWNARNAESFIRYTVNKGYTIHGWELGNELCGSGVGTRVTAAQYASDVSTLHEKVQEIYAGSDLAKPLVLAPGGFFDSQWFSDFVNEVPNKSVQALTHHIYNLGPGSSPDLVDKILDPTVLDGISKTFSDLQMLVKNSNTSAVAWVGESGGAYNSGHNLVTNAFIFSFWYLDQLGMSASYDTKTYCRQTLIGGNYGLLDSNTFEPNPDYYSALLWHRLMGNNVLSTSFSGTKKLRAYAHCSKKTQGITVLLINLGNTTVSVDVSIEKSGSSSGSNSNATKNDVREEYHLTAKDGDLQSRVMLLNGEELTVNSTGLIPSLEPMMVGISDPTSVAPFSIVFVHITNTTVSACKYR